jgi:hypothetical protein
VRLTKVFIGLSRFVGDNATPDGGQEISLSKIKSKEDKDGNASTEKYYRPVRDGVYASEGISGYAR